MNLPSRPTLGDDTPPFRSTGARQAPGRQAPSLHLLYRSYGGENNKGRPAYYSKLLALVSFLQVVDELGGGYEVIYINDGPIPSDRMRIMERTGEVLARERLGGRGSMRAALAVPAQRPWPDSDLVWFAEEDYLYKHGALRSLVAAAAAFPGADYLALYASIGDRAPDGKPQPVYASVPAGWTTTAPVMVQDHPWRRALSTTSTFGARVATIRRDRRMMSVAMASGGAWDHTTCLLYQGFDPFPWTMLTQHFGPSTSWKRKSLSLGVRGALNLYQAGRRLGGSPRRLLMAPDPPLSTHLETEHLAVATDWAGIAEQCRVWGREKGFLA